MNICFASDKNFVFLTKYSISSICKSNINEKINFYVIVPDREVAKEFQKFNNHNCSLETIIFDSNKLSSFKQVNSNITNFTYVRFFLDELLPDIDKVFYIDGDTIIKKSLHDLYEMDLNGYYMAAVKDIGMLRIWRDDSKSSIQNDTHVYAGQLLLNLKLMRKTNIFEKMREYKIYHQDLHDEDIINAICHPFIRFIPIKYCLSLYKILSKSHPEIYLNVQAYNEIYNTQYQSIEEMILDSVIIHFHGDKKKILNNENIKSIYNSYQKIVDEIFG